MKNTNIDNIIHEIEMLMDINDSLDEAEPSFYRLERRSEIMGIIKKRLDELGPPEAIPNSKPIARRYADGVKKLYTDYVCLWPWDDDQAVNVLIENIPSTSLELFSEYLSELKLKQPELYHPAWDRIIS